MEIGFQWRGPTYEFSILMKIQISIYLILTKYHKMKIYKIIVFFLYTKYLVTIIYQICNYIYVYLLRALQPTWQL